MAAAGTTTGSRRLGRVLAAGCVVVVAVLVAVLVTRDAGRSPESTPRPAASATPVAASLPGGWEVSAAPGVFAEDAAPGLTLVHPVGDAFVDDLGLVGGQVLRVSADQPRGAVTVSVPFSSATVPPGAVPAVFFFDDELRLWLPVPTTVDPGTGRLVATVQHFTDFTAGLLTWAEGAVQAAAGAVDWFTYQVASVTGARAQEPACEDPPAWVHGVSTGTDPAFPLAAALFACVQDADDDQAGEAASVSVAVNRVYALELTATPTPTTATIEPSADLEGALAQALSSAFGAEPGHVVVPGTATGVLTVPREPGTTSARISGAWTARSTVVDLLTKVVAAAGDLLVGDASSTLATIECSLAALQGAADTAGHEVFAGTWADITTDCLPKLATATGDAALQRLGTAIGVGLLLGQAGQSLLDAGRDRVDGAWVEVDWSDPGAGWLFDRTTGEESRSGERVDVVLGGAPAPDSSSQWVGCWDPSGQDYAMLGATRLTGTFGYRDFTPDDLVVDVRVLVDGQLVHEFTSQGDPMPVDVALPVGDVLRLEAVRVSGTCSSAPEGYAVWGEGRLS